MLLFLARLTSAPLPSLRPLLRCAAAWKSTPPSGSGFRTRSQRAPLRPLSATSLASCKPAAAEEAVALLVVVVERIAAEEERAAFRFPFAATMPRRRVAGLLRAPLLQPPALLRCCMSTAMGSATLPSTPHAGSATSLSAAAASPLRTASPLPWPAARMVAQEAEVAAISSNSSSKAIKRAVAPPHRHLLLLPLPFGTSRFGHSLAPSACSPFPSTSFTIAAPFTMLSRPRRRPRRLRRSAKRQCAPLRSEERRLRPETAMLLPFSRGLQQRKKRYRRSLPLPFPKLRLQTFCSPASLPLPPLPPSQQRMRRGRGRRRLPLIAMMIMPNLMSLRTTSAAATAVRAVC